MRINGSSQWKHDRDSMSLVEKVGSITYDYHRLDNAHINHILMPLEVEIIPSEIMQKLRQNVYYL